MRISLNWLRDYLDIKADVDANQIAKSLTMAGLEVEGIDYIKEKARLITLARVLEKCSDAKLQDIYLVEAEGEQFRVKASSNLIPESIVGIIMDNTSEWDGFRIATYADLGFSTAQHENICFPKDFLEASNSRQLADLPEFDDIIFSLSVTPNRPDALSHLGVSRELSALLDLLPRVPLLSVREMAGPTHEKAVVEINNSNDCPRYALRVIENIRIEPSPLWLRLRLMACGVRPINNVVDVTNYVMLSRGQPMHAYDYDKLKKENSRVKIIVRRAHNNEKFQSIDLKDVLLTPDDLVIADVGGPVALAGIMGGSSSAVAENTTSVLLESAYFDPKNLRMTSRRHQIASESSYRFERGADPSDVVEALNYAARLLVENSDAKACREPIDAYRQRVDPLEIKMRLDRAQSILGIDAAHFDQEMLRRKFGRLGIETVAKRGDAMYFRVPTFRADLLREIDLIEEAARMIGYDKVNVSAVGTLSERDSFSNNSFDIALKKFSHGLVARGFSEAMNYAFLSKEHHDYFLDSHEQAKLIEIKNPLSERYGVMRRSLIPGLVKNLLHNQRNQEKSVMLFEAGTVFLGKRPSEGLPEPQSLFGSLDQDSFSFEKQYLSGVMAGISAYSAFDYVPKALDFYDLKGVISDCLRSLGLDDSQVLAPVYYKHGSECAFMHPGESACIMLKDRENPVGHLGKLHPNIAEALDISAETFVFELDIHELAHASTEVVRFANFSRFPVITRDIALIAEEDVKIGDILEQASLVTHANETLGSISVFDIYRGKNIPAGKKSVALSLTLQKSDRTLTDEEAENFMSEFLRLVEQKTKAHVR
jgi:phenylalanyl-tRNA synthetase beta chain